MTAEPSAATPTAPKVTIRFETPEDIRAALLDPRLSRTFDRRSYAEGNIRDGIVSISHGPLHRARRRIENTQFRPDHLRLYEHELFPEVMGEVLDLLIDGETADLFAVGEQLSVVLAARRAGIDPDARDVEQLRTLVRYVDAFSQGSAILDAKDPDAIRRLVRETYDEFERDYVRPAWERRSALLARLRAGEIAEEDVPHDILTVLLRHRDDPALGLEDDGRVVREVATYLQGGTHTSAQVLVNAFDLLFEARAEQAGIVDRVATDVAFAQRVVHETLRLRPTTPRMKRHAEADTTINGHPIPAGATVVLDAEAANRDPRLYGPDADRFDPDRVLGPEAPRWGLSFGAGPHQCPGRSVAGGFPVPDGGTPPDDHLYGLVALMLAEVARRGVEPHPDRAPERDLRTERFTRWLHYPVRFRAPGVPAA